MRSFTLISNHRLRRYFTWAKLCVLRVAAALAEHSSIHAILPRWLRRRFADDVAILADIAATMIFLSACARVTPKRTPRTKRPTFAPRGFKLRAGASSWRAVVGSTLRRTLRGRTFGERLTAIANVLLDPEPAIAALARRLERGFHRRSGVMLATPARPGPIAQPRLPVLVAVDTS